MEGGRALFNEEETYARVLGHRGRTLEGVLPESHGLNGADDRDRAMRCSPQSGEDMAGASID